jgi:multidrug efflux pump subunit AcrA (membrane-fusion protein)
VTQVGVSPGQTIGPGATAVDGGATAPAATTALTTDGRTVAIRLVGAGSNSIVADASESDVGHLSPGQNVNLSFPGLAGQAASGTIAEIADTAVQAKDNSVSYPVRINITSELTMLKSGMTAQVNINMGDGKDVLVAPRGAIRSMNGQSLVSRVGSDGRVQDVSVQVGRTIGTDVELLGGVSEGDIVAVYQQDVTSAGTGASR